MDQDFIQPLDPGMGVGVASRTVFRDSDNKDWGNVAERVAEGNVSLVPGTSRAERRRLAKHLKKATVLLSGRHLQQGDADQASRPGEVFTNCSTAAFSFIKKYLLLNGSGVGRAYDDALMIVNWAYQATVIPVLGLVPETEVNGVRIHSGEHLTPGAKHPEAGSHIPTLEQARLLFPNAKVYTVSDSREGWAKSVEQLERSAWKQDFGSVILIDFSGVRPKGAPIGGMQNRPSSGPLPLMTALRRISELKGQVTMEPWEQTIRVDHMLAEVVMVGGARRAARIATKWWKDTGVFKFINIKREGDLWTANNSVAVDKEFWVEAKIEGTHANRVFKAVVEAQYYHGSGEPGFVNVDKITSSDEHLEIYEDGVFAGNSRFQIDGETAAMGAAVLKALRTMPYHYTVNPCGEIRLLVTGGYCVHGDTRILTRTGSFKIKDVVGQEVEVWNGEEWSKVTPFQTGTEQSLLRVTLSDGSVLDCTDYHRFAIKRRRQATSFQEVQAKDLAVGDILPGFRITPDIEGNDMPEAYTYGAFLGDGAYYKRPEGGVRREIILYPGKHHLPVTGTLGKEDSRNGGITATVGHLDATLLRALKQESLPEEIFRLNRESTLAFLAGWFDTDGVYHKDTGGVSLTTSEEGRARDLQLLLRRVGISFASMRKVAAVGDETNFGLRKKDLYQVYVPESEAGLIPGYRVNSNHEVRPERVVKQQRVVSVERLPGRHDTFCFTEPKRGMGVFGNMLTFQCVIGDLAPFFADTLDEVIDAGVATVRALIRTNQMEFLYGKETKRTNRVGVSLTGIQEFAWKFFGCGFRDLLDHEDKGKAFWDFIQRLRDAIIAAADEYADELDVTRPHTILTIKPAGTTSKLFALTEGAHLAPMAYYLRWVQYREDDPLVAQFEAQGYPVQRNLINGQGEPAYPGMAIVGFPTLPMITQLGMPDELLVTAPEADMVEQFMWVMLLEKYWLGEERGNQISYTLKYDREKISFETYATLILSLLPQVRCISVMPSSDWRVSKKKYSYVPEMPVSKEEFDKIVSQINERLAEDIDMDSLQCASGACPI